MVPGSKGPRGQGLCLKVIKNCRYGKNLTSSAYISIKQPELSLLMKNMAYYLNLKEPRFLFLKILPKGMVESL